MKRSLVALLAAFLLGFPAFASAQNYDAAVATSVTDYAAKGSFTGVTLNVACRRLPVIDFITSHLSDFENFTGATIRFTDYPENELRSHIVSDAANKAAGFQIYCLDDNYIPLFAGNHWVQPIDTAIKPAYKLDDLFDSLRGLYSWSGQLYGLPIYSEVTILYYRKDLFAAHHLSVPQTMTELENDARILNNPPRTFGIVLRGLRGEGMNVYIWTEWLRSYGGDFLGPTMHPIFNSPEGITATEHYAHLIRAYAPPGSGAWGWPQASSSFASGRVAIFVDSSAFYPVFTDPKQSSVVGKIGYALVPAGPKGRFPANYSIGLAVPATVKAGSNTQAAALAFLQWATSQQMEFARTAHDIGNEDRKSVANSALLKSKIAADYIAATTGSQAITKTEYRPLIAQWREMGDIIGAELESVFTGGKSAKAALDAAATQVTARFKAEGVLGTKRPYEELFPTK